MNTPPDHIEVIPSGVTAPLGYRAAGLHCGIRRSRRDLALLVSDVPAAAAGVFTTNRAAAAPVVIGRSILRAGNRVRGVIVNSGVANACTGERGLNDAFAMTAAVAAGLGVSSEEVFVASTGVIGQYLPMEKLLPGIERIVPHLSRGGGADAAQAIMTTDTYSKEYAVQFDLEGTTVRLGGMAKGSGMIAPNMATMLGFITTDLAIAPELLQKALSHANTLTFNRVSVDGDTSTNDMVLLFANGCAGNPMVESEDWRYERFVQALVHMMTVMARKIARDGEGATKLIEVDVRGAASEEEAEKIARAVAGSSLVKTAIHGADANWGRVVAAVGYADVDVDPSSIAVAFNGVPILEQGYNIVIDEERAHNALLEEEVTVTITLDRGDASACFWTCDLTKEYVHINASYRS